MKFNKQEILIKMTEKDTKIRLLKKLIEKSKDITVENVDDPDFKSWKNAVERVFIKVFGKDSIEFQQFNKLDFFYPALIYTDTSDYTLDHIRTFREDFRILTTSIKEYINDETDEYNEIVDTTESIEKSFLSKIFISHASKDSAIVEDIIEIFETIGVESRQIFCTSFEGYGIGLGDNFLDTIKEELSSKTLVIFVLSKNFYDSPVCLCEMGATWVLAKEHIPILIPPLDYKDVQGVIPLTQGLKINEHLKLNLLKEKVEKVFNIQTQVSATDWERKRNKIVSRIEQNIV